MNDTRRIEAVEHPEVPLLSLIFGYGPMLPLVLGGAGSWLLAGALRDEVALLTAVWATTILAFLAGVRRGLSFRTTGGPRVTQIVTMLGVFILALASSVLLAHGVVRAAVGCALAGFAALTVLDPIAARRGEAPLFFERLRPPQMAIATISLVALLVSFWFR